MSVNKAVLFSKDFWDGIIKKLLEQTILFLVMTFMAYGLYQLFMTETLKRDECNERLINYMEARETSYIDQTKEIIQVMERNNNLHERFLDKLDELDK